MKEQHIIFDLDGTLIDSEEAVLKTWQQTLLAQVNRYFTLEALRVVLGITSKAALKILLVDVKDDFEQYWIKQYERFAKEMKYFDGMEDMLRELTQRGCTLGIVTSRTKEEYDRYFTPFQFNKRFSIILCADDTSKHKPDPEPLYKYLEVSGADKANCLYIGDMLTDIRCAKSAGMRSGFANWKQSNITGEADYIFTDPKDILLLF